MLAAAGREPDWDHEAPGTELDAMVRAGAQDLERIKLPQFG
ncbi:MAG: hypothetical protein JW395_0511 [Nitrospira sp.]|nr:hypothetical protein [Nitrospira sp.]